MAVQKLQRCENTEFSKKWCSYWEHDPDTVCDMVLTGRCGNFSGLAYLANYCPIALGMMFGRCLGSPKPLHWLHGAIIRCNRLFLIPLTGVSTGFGAYLFSFCVSFLSPYSRRLPPLATYHRLHNDRRITTTDSLPLLSSSPPAATVPTSPLQLHLHSSSYKPYNKDVAYSESL